MKFARAFASVSLAFILCNVSVAQVNYLESASGDLAGPSTPTSLGTLGLGANSVSGSLNTAGFNPDAFSFDVAIGHELTSLSFTSLTGSRHFLAVNDGALNENSAAGNMVSTLISSADVGVNILDGSLNDQGGSGITNPLGSGSYNVWFQETNGSLVDYSISLQTAAVPEPSGFVALALGGVILLGFHPRGACRR